MCKKHKREITVEDVTIAADTFTLLMPHHLHFSHQKGILRDNSGQTEVLREPSVFFHSSNYQDF